MTDMNKELKLINDVLWYDRVGCVEIGKINERWRAMCYDRIEYRFGAGGLI